MYVHVDQRPYHYLDSATPGEPLVLLHGLGGSTEDWMPLIPTFAEHYRVIALDLRGHGRSFKGQTAFSLADAAAEAWEVLRLAGVPRAHLFGISMGGMVAQHMALQAPARVGRLILHNTAASTAPRDWATRRAVFIRRHVVPRLSMARTARLISEKLFPRPDQAPLRAYIEAQWVKNDPADYVRITEATLAHRLGPAVAAITAPTLVLAAEHDGTIPRAAMAELAAWIPGARLEIVPDCGHGAPLEKPAEIAARALAFLGEERG